MSNVGSRSLGRRSGRLNATGALATGQVGFAAFITVCVLLHPGFVLKANEGGISNYGVHAKTFVPYSLGLITASGFSYRAASMRLGSSASTRPFRLLLRTYSVFLLVTLLTTYGYTLNTPLKELHIVVGVATIVFETAASVWMYRVTQNNRLAMLIELVGFILAALTFFGAVHLLFASQLVTGGAFAVLLVGTGAALARAK
jgi:hypothetical protein